MSASQLVEGYVLCPRIHDEPEYVRKEVAQRTGGICSTCFAAEGGKLIRHIELVCQGQRLRVPLSPKRVRKDRRYRPERNYRKTLNAKARERARKRLAEIHSDLYDVLLAEERAKLGLDPWPIEIAVRGTTPDIRALADQLGVQL